MEFMAYINRYFISEEKLQELLGLTHELFLKYQKLGAIPKCSYHILNNHQVSTDIFGEREITGGVPGKYYPKAVVDWVNRAKSVLEMLPEEEIENRLKENFYSDYISVFKQLKDLKMLYPHFFNSEDELLIEPLEKQAESTWKEHLKGTYGICVVNPIDVSAIIQKQVAVTRLIQITDNGQKAEFSKEEKEAFIDASKTYDKAAMPFSPVDYPTSSRKRLLDDVKLRLKAN